MVSKLLPFIVLVSSIMFAQTLPVQVSINSGNPAIPFPQFQPYTNSTATLGNVGTNNSVGVPHAEMEKTIREAYQIMMNRAVKPGGGVGGIDYVYFNSEPSCSEGDGYAMLGAVAMADKTTFDGLWLWVHDNAMNKVKRYSDCQESSPGYRYSQLPGWTNIAGENSAADGDFDIGLALLCAYKQWGEFMGINDACGNPISYKQAAIDFLKGMTDTLLFVSSGTTYLSGDIGFDGYFKGGDSWQELTDWASNPAQSGLSIIPESKGPQTQYFDYTAPAYFNQFAKFLTEQDPSAHAWNIKQFQRAEASSDWLMGQMLTNPGTIPYAGHVTLGSDNVPVFGNVQASEDFRLGWRTILNYVWHGDPSSTWDPVTHQVIAGTGNTFEQDIGKRYARFLWDNRQDPWNNSCVAGADGLFTYWGPQVLWTSWNLSGTDGGFFFLNWIQAVGSPSAVASQDYELMSEMYRQLEIEWDGEDAGEGYLTSVPTYFHGWYRLLGLLVLSGNYHAPSQLIPTANMKVYLDIDKTFAFEGDIITYTIDYRNFGSLDAANVIIVDTLHPDFVFKSATGGGVFDAQANTVTWNVGTVPGFKTATGITPTTGQFGVVVEVGNATRNQYRNKVSVSCANGTGWTSNEYPNKITTVMERNYLDIAKRALIIEKSASSTSINPGDEIDFTINFENTSEAGWINGGRSGVQLAYARTDGATSGPNNTMGVRLFHDAQEGYIDYGNYRISYFLFDPGLTCYAGTDGCATGWEVQTHIIEGLNRDFIKIFQENITPGQDTRGKWNQRIVVQFSDPTNPLRVENLATIDHHLREYAGMTARIHRGGTMPLRIVWDLHSSNWTNVIWDDDWSYNAAATDDAGGIFWPITGDWTDPDNPDIPVNTWDPKGCETATHSVDNILVEEWDGYTWRRIFGNGPLPGRDAVNVVIRDTIPAGLTFGQFTGDPPLGISPTVSENVITWTIPKLQIKQAGTIKYTAKASGSCPVQDKSIMTKAWIWADQESPVSDSVLMKVTCDSIPPPPPPPNTIYKRADRSSYQVGDTVVYSVAYKQTHGNIVTDASDAAQWIDMAGTGKLGIGADGTISYDRQNARMVYTHSYGLNGTIGGTITPATYSEFSIVMRDNGTDFVEIRMKQDYGDMWVRFYNFVTQVGGEQRFSYTGFPGAFNFKIELSDDVISLWAGDTSALLPNVRQSGIDVRSGYAGVKSGNDPGTTISGWNSHFDKGIDVVISDAVPQGLTFISAGGEISTGALAGTNLTAVNTNGVVQWQVVSGDTQLDYGDSITVWLRALCDACTGDSIINTAYTNLRGYPLNTIAAQVRSPCMEDPGVPDHLDIVTDTTNIDLRNDVMIDQILMDAGTSTFQVYAVIRDADGNYIERTSQATWTSGDESIVSVSGIAGVPWGGLITKTGSGETIIVVTQPGLKPDSVKVVAQAPPPWPIIVSAVMGDQNGDLIPDRLVVTLNDTFMVNQSLNNVVIDYKGDSYTVFAATITQQGLTLYIPFQSRSGTDAAPSGNVTMLMTVESSTEQSSRSFTDGVGPSLTGAVLSEDLSGDIDTLSIGFSENINPQTLTDATLFLIRSTTGDTVPISFLSVNMTASDRAIITVTGPGGIRLQEGDMLRLLPGEQSGTITDFVGNKPHLLNQAVLITAKPAQLTSAWYVDEQGNGVVNAVYLQFYKPATLEDILFSLSWGGAQRLNDITSEYFSYGANNTIVKVALPDSFKVGTGIKTSGNMFVLVESVSFSDLWWSVEAWDSAAPVLDSAAIFPGIMLDEFNSNPDTLKVVFTENVDITQINPFILFQLPGTDYYLSDQVLLSLNQNNAEFLFTAVSGVDFPKNGDSIRISPFSTVRDSFGSWQNNPQNRRVALIMGIKKVNWIIQAGPNPFNPVLGQLLTFNIVSASITRIKPDIKNISLNIYDVVGNIVLRSENFTRIPDGLRFDWNGRNKKGRIVGNGVYLAIIRIEDDKGTRTIKKQIGVKR